MGSITLNKPSGGQLTLSPEDGATNETVTIPAGGVMPADAPTGKILQVKQVVVTSAQTLNSQSSTSVGLKVSITPVSSTSKILVSGVANLAWDQGAAKVGMEIFRDGATSILRGDVNGSRQRVTNYLYWDTNSYAPTPCSFEILDSPNTTSEIEYECFVRNLDPQGTVALNRSIDGWTDNFTFATTASTITVMEVAQ